MADNSGGERGVLVVGSRWTREWAWHSFGVHRCSDRQFSTVYMRSDVIVAVFVCMFLCFSVFVLVRECMK